MPLTPMGAGSRPPLSPGPTVTLSSCLGVNSLQRGLCPFFQLRLELLLSPGDHSVWGRPTQYSLPAVLRTGFPLPLMPRAWGPGLQWPLDEGLFGSATPTWSLPSSLPVVASPVHPLPSLHPPGILGRDCTTCRELEAQCPVSCQPLAHTSKSWRADVCSHEFMAFWWRWCG